MLLPPGIMPATAECVTIPYGPDVPTHKDFDNKYLGWLQRVTLEAYSQSTPDPDPRLQDFLGKAIRAEVQTADAPGIKSVIDQGAALLNSGNRSPWLLGWYGIMLVQANRDSDAVPILQEALAIFENTEDINIVQMSFITGYLAKALDKGSRTERSSSRDMMLKHIALMTRAVAEGAFPGPEIQIAYRLISTRFIEPLNKQRWKHYHEQLEKFQNIDPWYKLMIEGRTENQRGWDARGGGFASSVTAEGWAGMEKHGRLAYQALKKAYDLHPEFPEAAASLSYVALTGQTPQNETPTYWFEKSVAAQMDYELAYEYYNWSLRPRWGGSHEAMRALADQCLATERYDTIVPYIGFSLIRNIAEEMPINAWYCVFRDPETEKSLNAMFNKYRNNPLWNSDWKQKFSLQELLFSTWLGRYPEAKKYLSANHDRPDIREGIFKHSFSWDNMSWNDLEGEIRAMTGPEGKTLSELRTEQCQLAQILYTSTGCRVMNPSQSGATLSADIDRLVNRYKSVLSALKEDQDAKRWLATCTAGIILNSSFNGSYTPLHTAIRDLVPEVARFLLENGIDPDDKGVMNISPLRYAINKNRIDIVHMLLESGASIENNENETMLFSAVSQQNVELISLLLRHGADINEADVYGRTPIHDAVIKNRMMLCRFLIENGADVNTISGNHESLLQIALHHKAYDVAKLLLTQDIDVNVVDGNGYSPVYFALDAGELDIVRSIIDQGLDLSIPSPSGYPILHTAAFYGYTDILQLLLEKGADINQLQDGHTAEEFADHYKKPDAAKFLKKWKREHKTMP